MPFRIFVALIITAILVSCGSDSHKDDDALIVEGDPYISTIPIDMEIINIADDGLIELEIDNVILFSDKVVVVSSSYSSVYILDRKTGEIDIKLTPEIEGDPNCFNSPDRVTKLDDAHFEVYDSVPGILYLYSKYGKLLSKVRMPFHYRNIYTLNDSMDLVSVAGMNNSHLSIDSIALVDIDFFITKNGIPHKILGSTPAGLGYMTDHTVPRNFFEWNETDVYYFHPYTDTIYIFSPNFKLKKKRIDFSNVGVFANLRLNNQIEERMDYVERHGLVWMSGFYKSKDKIYIRYAKNSKENLFIYDTTLKSEIYHSGFLRLKGMKDIGWAPSYYVDEDQFATIVPYFLLNEMIESPEVSDKSKNKLIQMLAEKDIYVQNKDFKDSREMFAYNPALFIFKIK